MRVLTATTRAESGREEEEVRVMEAKNFSELPNELLSMIIDKVSTFSLLDYVRFGAVCSRWRSAFIDNHERIKLYKSLPVLMIPSSSVNEVDDDKDRQRQQEEQQNENTWRVYSLSDRCVCNFQLRVPYNWVIRGSSNGWLVLESEAGGDFSVRLLNPFRSGDVTDVQLPPLTHLEHEYSVNGYHIIKAVISTNPSTNPDDFVVVAINNFNDLALYRPGDRAWTTLPYEKELGGYHDVIYYNGQIYAIAEIGQVIAFDLNPLHHLEPEFVAQPPRGTYALTRKYIVESSGNLLQVHKYFGERSGASGYRTFGFQVFKMDMVGSNSWVELRNLDDHMLFLGTNTSLSLLASDFPGCMPNCIYFTDDFVEGHMSSQQLPDMGIFNLKDGSLESHYQFKAGNIFPPVIWIQPTM